MKITQINLTKS